MEETLRAACLISFNVEKYRVTMGWISASVSWLGFDAWFEVLAMGVIAILGLGVLSWAFI